MGTTELESVTSCMSSKRSNQLSYAPKRIVTILSYRKTKELSSIFLQIFAFLAKIPPIRAGNGEEEKGEGNFAKKT